MEQRIRQVKKMIPKELWKKARHYALDKDMTMTDFLNQAIENELRRVGAFHTRKET